VSSTARMIGICILTLPTLALASDMTALLFVFTLPACLVLVGIAFIMGATLTPSTIGWLALPIGGIVAIHLYLLPHMQHDDELAAWAIQLAISSTSLFAIRMVRKRAKRKEMNAPTQERQQLDDTDQS